MRLFEFAPFFFKNGGELLYALCHPANFRICALGEGILGPRHRIRSERQKFLGELGSFPGLVFPECGGAELTSAICSLWSTTVQLAK